jgi:hypothetical protein
MGGMQTTRRQISLKILSIAFLILAVAIPRLVDLDRFVTIDEPRWMARSANFYNGLVSGSLFASYQSKHPGVTTMLAGAAGFGTRYPEYPEIFPDQLEDLRSVEPIMRRHGQPPMDVLEGGRIFVALMIALFLVASFYYANRLMGFWPSVFGMSLIAFDAFHIAHSRVLQLDGIMSSVMLLSLLALLSYLFRNRRARDLMASGVAAGIATLTRSPGLFLAPFTGMLVSIDYWLRFDFDARELMREWLKPLLIWGATLGAAFILLWPALWVHPKFVLLEVFGEAISAASGGHDAPTFFNGQVFDGDPGFIYYPVNFLWRTSPVVLIGIILSICELLRPGSHIRKNQHRGWLLSLIAFAILYTAFVTLSAKKFDRYLLPIFAPLDLMAAMGWFSALHGILHNSGIRRITANWKWLTTGNAMAIVIAVLVLIQAVGAMATSPYFLSYYNPLMGGAARAPEVMMIGWGEGLDEAARYLNEKKDASDLDVIAWYASGPFDYFFEGKSTTLHSFEKDLGSILEYDYAVLYIHQWQRELPSVEILNNFHSVSPEYVVTIDGIDYAAIYKTSDLQAPGG